MLIKRNVHLVTSYLVITINNTCLMLFCIIALMTKSNKEHPVRLEPQGFVPTCSISQYDVNAVNRLTRMVAEK